MTPTVTARTGGAKLLGLVDREQFEALFVDELGWDRGDTTPFTATLDGQNYILTPVASYKGLRIWHCPSVPSRPKQRDLDAALARTNTERLLIFTESKRQEWRWPRRGRTAGANSSLITHRHTVGQANPDLVERLDAVRLADNEDPTLVELIGRMAGAFNHESETAARRAARLMKALYEALQVVKMDDELATSLLTRLLFLMFADDTAMWRQGNTPLFENYLTQSTAADTLHRDLEALFDALNTETNRRPPATEPLLARFAYVNGQLFDRSHDAALPSLPPVFRERLLEACRFDWGSISPAVFGSMFQTVKDKSDRREGGEFYTTESNILKTIGPLFLDELHERLEAAWDNKGRLTELINALGRLRIMDPACGCGNFLIVAYQQLRALELTAMLRRRDLDLAYGPIPQAHLKHHPGQQTLDASALVNVQLNNFYGLEIDEWPARIAQVAMLLVDHLANQAMEDQLGTSPIRLPITITPVIRANVNALDVDWATVLPPSTDVVIVGNPPFRGRKYRTAQQTQDMRNILGRNYNVNLDYVTSWWFRAIEYFGATHDGRWAFVSTNSVSQGEPVNTLWEPILANRWRVRFAHRSLTWRTEARADEDAGVTVSIVGFDRGARSSRKPLMWEYERDASEGSLIKVVNINPYLVEGPDVLVKKPQRVLNPQMPKVGLGSMPNDGGALIVKRDELAMFQADPIASKYLRLFPGAKELLHGKSRHCLWMAGPDWDPADAARSRLLGERIEQCRQNRLESENPDTVAKAATPHLFWFNGQPESNYLCLPSTISEFRSWYTPAYFDQSVVSSNLNYVAADPDGFAFGILSSAMFMSWMKTVGGRNRNDLRFSTGYSYASFPLPDVSREARDAVLASAQDVIKTRGEFPELTLAQLYGPAMPSKLTLKHQQLDVVVDSIFGARGPSEHERRTTLFASYVKISRKH